MGNPCPPSTTMPLHQIASHVLARPGRSGKQAEVTTVQWKEEMKEGRTVLSGRSARNVAEDNLSPAVIT
ncbi:hypothetical protein EYF80_007158 [Liparis tanakae]|uniref:Uncharacterized protein n=1 Tax=Liparis tanakae TaxID=230148 RepID=A0A4Z2IXD4_9TELE|nr:hypothetical protein EYF80_007158 [Liparis tanakae]